MPRKELCAAFLLLRGLKRSAQQSVKYYARFEALSLAGHEHRSLNTRSLTTDCIRSPNPERFFEDQFALEMDMSTERHHDLVGRSSLFFHFDFHRVEQLKLLEA